MVTVRRGVAMGAMRGINDRDVGFVADFPDEVALGPVYLRLTEVEEKVALSLKIIVTFTRIKSTQSS